MITPVVLPQVELTMESAVIARWLVKVGETVAAGQNLVEIETQKAVSEVSAPTGGIVRKLCFSDGVTVSANATLCILTTSADEPFEAEQAPAVSEAIRASPAARKAARELGVELRNVRGTGPDGRITPEDVAAFARSKPAESVQDGWEAIPSARLAFNAQMARSLSEIPQIAVHRRIEVSPLFRAAEGITFTHRLVLAAAAALGKHPAIRTATDGRRSKVMPLAIAIAIDAPSGLIAPVLRERDLASLEAISRRLSEFRGKAANRELRNEELSDGPFAISNLGMLGVDFFTPFVFHGQTAVLAVGRAVESSEGRFAWFSLAVDHRVVDGSEAARFLGALEREIRAA